MRIVSLFLSVLLAIPATGQRRTRVEEGVTPIVIEGIVYALPRTGLRINVKAVKETFEPGPYAAYAEHLLGITNAKNHPSVKWMIGEPDIETFSEPDPEQVYKALGHAAYLVDLTSDGRLAGINTGKSPGGVTDIKTNPFIERDSGRDRFSFAQFNDSPLFAPGDSSNNFRPTRISTERKAAEAAERILECRLTRFHMAAGLMDEFHPDGEAYKISLLELENIEKGYLSLFTGRTIRQKEVFSFDYVPVTVSERGDVVFRFSEENGILPASDLSGKPVTVKIEPGKELNAKYSALIPSNNPTAGESGIYYRMPAIVDIHVLFELKAIATARTVMAQFGQIAPLPDDLLFGDHAIEFHPETGAVKSVRTK